METKAVEKFFSTIKPDTAQRYTDYWESIKPTTTDEVFKRYLFAFTSVHTTWAGNVRGYLALKDLGWLDNKDTLLSRLVWARCGMYRNRTKAIWAFKEQFYANPEFYSDIQGDWRTHRNLLVDSIKGLGITKVSFALEMCFPKEALVSCIDTHGLQLYGIEQKSFSTKIGLTKYEEAEDHWIDNSVDAGVSPTIARAIFWDVKQKQTDSKYWTYVLEN